MTCGDQPGKGSLKGLEPRENREPDLYHVHPLWHLLLRCLLLCYSLLVAAALNAAPPVWLLEQSGLRSDQLALVINRRDPYSLAIGQYYQQQRKIPARQVIEVEFDPGQAVMKPGVFAVLQRQIERQLTPSIQAFALAWTQPYRVGCMSMTSAFAFGYDVAYCATGCQGTRRNPYAGSNSRLPFSEHQIRPAMMLAGDNIADGMALIDRGVASDSKHPGGRAYLLRTSDNKRTVREVYFDSIKQQLGNKVPVTIVDGDSLQDRNDILFYFTGSKFVENLDSNRFIAGAVADHLTSSGGVLYGGNQMSILRWLQAGATGSYGTVVEPCNMLGKFPNPLVLMANYLSGQTLLEAYWKSVQMPGQGLFVGEPLARPWRGYRLQQAGEDWRFFSPLIRSGYYRVWASESAKGPFQALDGMLEVRAPDLYFQVSPPHYGYYRFQRLDFLGPPDKP